MPSPSSLQRNIKRVVLLGGLAAAALMLSGCNMVVMDPKGPIGMQEKDLIILAVLLMLIPVLPVIFMTFWFAWRYRASNKKATYAPDFEHSNRIEAVVWAVPTLIIIALGSVTWISTHELDPRAPLAHVSQPNVKPIEVEVVSLDWKWLFIYPEYNIATVNELAVPVGTPVHFKLTSATVMNSFFIPQLGSQIYTMTGMETQLNLRADHTGVYEGISANYSGHGFAGMKFSAVALNDADFKAWVAKAQAAPAPLDAAAYAQLAKPGMEFKPTYYATVEPMLFHKVLNNCTDGKMCREDAMNMAMMKNIAPDAEICKPGEEPKKINKTFAPQTPVSKTQSVTTQSVKTQAVAVTASPTAIKS
ncbi:ubiquinol oxidase subunit II [Asticcacaulis sp. MM231]|uniref:ubiquinol oxidase subunit II n=1 Tax=Asticcacaulis sp. MM231 TaxID=3157666 RepID=UPI0032D5A8C9